MLSNGHLNSKIDETVTKKVGGFVSKGTGNYFKGKIIYGKTKQAYLDKIASYLIALSEILINQPLYITMVLCSKKK